jgi:hypothetical protein
VWICSLLDNSNILIGVVSVFGFVFSALAEIGKPHLVFICNAVSISYLSYASMSTNSTSQGVAVLAVFILAFSRFPPKDSKRIVNQAIAEDES